MAHGAVTPREALSHVQAGTPVPPPAAAQADVEPGGLEPGGQQATRPARRPGQRGRVPPLGTVLRYRRLRTALRALNLCRCRREWPRRRRRVGPGPVLAGRAQWDEAPPCMRWRGLAQPRGAVLPISQRLCAARPPTRARNAPSAPVRPDHRVARGLPAPMAQAFLFAQTSPGFPPSRAAPSISLSQWLRAFFSPNDRSFPKPKGSSFPFAGWLRVFFSSRDSGFPLRRTT